MASKSNWAAASERDSLLYNKKTSSNEDGSGNGNENASGYTQLAGSNNRHHRNVYDGLRRPSIRRIIRAYPKPVPIKWTETLSKTGVGFTIIMVLVFFLLIVFKVWFNLSTSSTYMIPNDPLESRTKVTNIKDQSELLLVNVLFRHGDRAPEYLDHLGMQQLQPRVKQIWPHGLQNLTDIGRSRMFKVGLELSRLYRLPLSAYENTSLLALSSNYPRCIESMQTVLMGFYNPESLTLDKAVEELVAIEEHCQQASSHNTVDSQTRFCALLANSSTNNFATDEWKRVKIDSESLRSLRSKYVVENCPKFNIKNCIIYNNLTHDSGLTSLPGFRELQQHISNPINQPFDYNLASFYGSLNPILKSASIPAVRQALAPHTKWIAQPIKDETNKVIANNNGRNLTLLNTYESLNMMADTICADQGVAGDLQINPIITTIVKSQATALHDLRQGNAIFWGRKIIMYATHDTIIESLLNHLKIRTRIVDGSSYLEQLQASGEANSQLNNLLGGLKRPEPGASVVFELWKTRIAAQTEYEENQIHYVRLLIYQREDATHQRVQFERVKLGSVCMRSFLELHDNNTNDLDKFYANAPEEFNRDLDCPYQLWKNVTSKMMIANDAFDEACHK